MNSGSEAAPRRDHARHAASPHSDDPWEKRARNDIEVARVAQQRAQQCLPKSLLLYYDGPCPARQPLATPPAGRRGPGPSIQPTLVTVPAHPVPIVILDTNVVLDWLVFRDARSQPLALAITSETLHWYATPAMREELDHVLGRPPLTARAVDSSVLWRDWARWCTEVVPNSNPLSVAIPQCTDRDDQKFIDLALTLRARWLVSRDRAVLALARRLRDWGVQVVTPEGWSAPAD